MADEHNNVIAFKPRPKPRTGSGSATAVAERPKATATTPAPLPKHAAPKVITGGKPEPKHAAAKPTKREHDSAEVRTVRANDKIQLRGPNSSKPAPKPADEARPETKLGKAKVEAHDLHEKHETPEANEKHAAPHLPHFLHIKKGDEPQQAKAEVHARPNTHPKADSEEKSDKKGIHLPEFTLPEIHIEPPTPEQLRKMGIVALIVAVVIGFLYVPARSLYVARRDEAVLTMRLEQLESENAELQHSIETLQTHEGIEDEARRRGYVIYGETPVVVQGLEGAEGEQQADDIAMLTANGSVEEENLPWYIVLGDFIFQYSPTF